ncbi:MAG: GNAT family N-acetyltransferase [Nocardioides sp.]
MAENRAEPAPGLWVRPEAPTDTDAVHEVVRAAFGGDQVPDLLDDLRRSVAWLDLSWVAERAGEVVGHVSLTRAWVDDPEAVVEVLVLSPLSVRPDVQGRGIGTALVRAALAAADRRTEPVVFLEGDPRYYSMLGFVEAGPLGFARPSPRIPERAFQAWLTPAHRPGMSGALVYPDVFWRHDAVGLRP